MKARLTRIALRYFRTGRYLAELLVWSRVFVVRRTAANITINPELRAAKGLSHAQPQIRIGGRSGAEHFEHGFNIVYDILFANLRKANHLVPLRHALPAPAFAGVYLWDSAFIAQIWRHWDRQVALEVLQSVVALRDGAKLQHVVADFVRSAFTQPPLIAWSAARIINEQPQAGQNLEALYAALTAYHQWLNDNRQLPSGLYFWAHPYESGVENAPRFSSTDEKSLADTTQLAAPDLSAYVVLQCEALAEIAARLQRDEQARAHADAAKHLRQRINDRLWHEEDGLYYDRDERSGQFVRSRTIASLIPLAAGVADRTRAERLLAWSCDAAAFGSPIPLPSVALNDPDFEKDMWRGPVWINTAYLVLEGLKRYGFHQAYGELAWRLCDGVFRVLQSEHQVYEFYDPEFYHTHQLNRKKGNLWKAFTLGTGPQKDFVGWSGLVNTLLIECLLGYQCQHGSVTVRPNLPDAAAGLHFDLQLPQDNCRLKLSVSHGPQYRGEIQLAEAVHPFALKNGESFTVALPEQTGEPGASYAR